MIRSPVASFHGGAALAARSRLPGHGGAFAGITKCKYSVTVAYGATILNPDIVNGESGWPKQADFCQKLRETGRFLYFKNTVNYNIRFFVNAGTVHFRATALPVDEPIVCVFNGITAVP